MHPLSCPHSHTPRTCDNSLYTVSAYRLLCNAYARTQGSSTHQTRVTGTRNNLNKVFIVCRKRFSIISPHTVVAESAVAPATLILGSAGDKPIPGYNWSPCLIRMYFKDRTQKILRQYSSDGSEKNFGHPILAMAVLAGSKQAMELEALRWDIELLNRTVFRLHHHRQVRPLGVQCCGASEKSSVCTAHFKPTRFPDERSGTPS